MTSIAAHNPHNRYDHAEIISAQAIADERKLTTPAALFNCGSTQTGPPFATAKIGEPTSSVRFDERHSADFPTTDTRKEGVNRDKVVREGGPMNEQTDEQLMGLYRDGNRQAFDLLVERYHEPLVAYVKRRAVRNEHAAEDIVQRVWMRVFKHHLSFDLKRTFRAWLYSMAARLSINERRDTRKFRDMGEEVFEEVLTQDDQVEVLEDEVEKKETIDQAMRVLRALPKEYRSVLQLSVMQGFTVRQTCPLLDIAIGTVFNRTHEGIRRLREGMEQGVVTSVVSDAQDDWQLSTIRDIVDRLPHVEYGSVERVLFSETADDSDLHIFGSFVRRLAGEILSPELNNLKAAV